MPASRRPLLATVRSVFVIGPDKKVKAMLTYPMNTGLLRTLASCEHWPPMNTGRNFDEVLRLLDPLRSSH